MNLAALAITESTGITPMKPFGLRIEASRGVPPPVTSLAVNELRDLTRRYHLLVLRGFAALEEEEFDSYTESWGQRLRWNFGYVLNLFQHPQPANYLFTNGNVPMHWDGAFAEDVPEFQIFSCVYDGGKEGGGQTLFSNTSAILDDASHQQMESWRSIRVTYQTNKIAHYGGTFTSPIVCPHPLTGRPVIRFGQPADSLTSTLNPFTATAEGCTREAQSEIFTALAEKLYDERFCYQHEWLQGDIVIADNLTLLHGRKSYQSGCGRHLRRVHIL